MGWFQYQQKIDATKYCTSLRGKVMIVTGGSSGIGYATVQHLARRGAKVYMAARDGAKAQAALERLHDAKLAGDDTGGEVVWLELELGDPRNVRHAAETFLSKEKRLDVLINNAAMPRGPYTKTHDGIQDIMMVNHISHFVFTALLLPCLQRTAGELGSDVRIVNVSSNGIRFLKRGIRFRNVEDVNDEHACDLSPSLARYCRSKLASVLFTTELQRRLDAAHIPIITLSLNPGMVRTDGILNDAASMPPVVSHLFRLLIATLWTPPERGAHTSVFAAAAPEVRARSQEFCATYLQPPGIPTAPPHADARDARLAKELWGTTVDIVKGLGIEMQDGWITADD